MKMCVSVNVRSGLQQPCLSLAGTGMLSIAVSGPPVSLAVDIQFNTVLNSGRAEHRILGPRIAAPLWEGSCPTRQVHGFSPWLEFVFQLSLEKIATELLCYLLTKRIQQEDSLSSCGSFSPLVHTLTSSCHCERGVIISLLLPSPAERCVFLRQGLPLAETDLCLTPISSRYHSDICNSIIWAKWPIHRLCTEYPGNIHELSKPPQEARSEISSAEYTETHPQTLWHAQVQELSAYNTL